MNLDRFSQGIPDQQCANIVGWCRWCDMEIYKGDEYGESMGIHEECQEEIEEDNDD